MSSAMSSHLVNNTYEVIGKLGQGKFGVVYKAITKKGKNTGNKVAVKYDVSDYNVLKHETNMLGYLQKRSSIKHTGIPWIIWYGKSICIETKKVHTCLVIPYYEMSLHQYIQRNGNPGDMAIKTWKDEIISILRHIHDLYVIHRDIKPENFMLRVSGDHHRQPSLVLIDFGLATFYVDGKTGNHIPENVEPKTDIVGSPLYASINVHRGIKAARRDDYIQLGYVMLFIVLGGRLPWAAADSRRSEEVDASILRIDHPLNQERYRMKLKVLEWTSNSWLGQYFDKCYALDYKSVPSEAEGRATLLG
jgi:serine/threonine protein kinase